MKSYTPNRIDAPSEMMNAEPPVPKGLSGRLKCSGLKFEKPATSVKRIAPIVTAHSAYTHAPSSALRRLRTATVKASSPMAVHALVRSLASPWM